MAIDTSIYPYFDDYSEDKNFHKILFRPGVAVQARELTQTQTILQDQIRRLGNYVFTNGDKVTGPKPIINLDARRIKLRNTDSLGRPIDLNLLLDTYVLSPTNDVIGLVEFVYEEDTPEVGDVKSIVITLKKFNTTDNGNFDEASTLYFYRDYVDALNNGTPDYTAIVETNSTLNVFSTLSSFSKDVRLEESTNLIKVGDLLVIQGLNFEVYVTEIVSQRELRIDKPIGFNVNNEKVSYVRKSCNPTTILTQDSATFYNDGYFLKSATQKIVVDPNTAFPTKYVGFFYEQKIVDHLDDPSLLDPAVGSSNYFAPGADRLQINLNLTSVNINQDGDPDTREDFLPVLKFVKGEIEYVQEVSGYSELDRKLAERTYDESGNYIVDKFSIIPGETLPESNTLIFSITPGLAYIGGFQVKTVSPTTIEIPKNVSTEVIRGYNINTTQGNYFKIEDIQGSLFASDQIVQSLNFLEGHSDYNPTSANTKVADIEVRNIEFDSLNGNKLVYKLFINNIASVEEVPLDWPSWSRAYKIPEDSGRQLANILYEQNLELPFSSSDTPIVYTPPGLSTVTITPSSGVRFYSLNREPDASGLAFWYRRWEDENFDLTRIVSGFISEQLQKSFNGGPDNLDRLTSNTKGFLSVLNNSPFYNGLINPKDIKSIVRVSNPFTSYADSSSYTLPSFKANVSTFGRLGDAIVTFDKKESDTLLFPTNKDYVKGVTRIGTEYTKTVKGAAFVSGVYTKTFSEPEFFPIGNGEIGASTARQYITMVVRTGATANVAYGTWDFEEGKVTVLGDSLSVQIDTGDSSFNGTADINFRIENDSVVPRVKTLIDNQYKVVDIQLADKDYSLSVSDIAEFKGIFRLGNVTQFVGEWSPAITYDYNQIVTFRGIPYVSIDFTTNVAVEFANAWTRLDSDNYGLYVLDDGQRDNLYDHGSIKYVGGGTPGNVLITYSYYTHSGEGPVVVSSYPNYDSIPTYRSVVTSRDFNLRDCIDFRPRRQDLIPQKTFQQTIYPVSSVNTEADIEYYLGRIDRLYVTNRNDNFTSPYNRFYADIGIQSLNPLEPTDISDFSKLAIAVLEIPPYTVSSFDVVVQYIDNKRFTMSDIGKLEDLIVRIDKAVKLQAIEVSMLKNIITNEEGDILLKSGVLVEDFSSLDKSELSTGYFSCAIDEDEKECFPAFAAYNLDLFITDAGSEIFLFNDIITKKYTEELFVSNLEGNNIINVNPGAVNDGRGRAIVTKKNSFSLNLLNSAGAMIIQGIASKTLAAYIAKNATGALSQAAYGFAKGSFSRYALSAAYNQESILQIAWGATRDLGMNFYNAVTSIDGLTKFVVDSISPFFDVASAVYNWASKGLSTIIPGFGSAGAGAGAAAGAGAGAGAGGAVAAAELAASTSGAAAAGSLSAIVAQGVATFGEGIALVGQSLSYILQGNVATGIQGLGLGFKAMATAITATTLNAAVLATSTLATATAGIPIIGSVTASIAAGTSSLAATILASPALTVVAAVVIVYAAVKIVSKAWKKLKKAFSDDRMKEDIRFLKRMDNGLNLYSFKYKKQFEDIAGRGYKQGYLASEVEQIYPNAVSIAENGYRMIDYSKIRKI